MTNESYLLKEESFDTNNLEAFSTEIHWKLFFVKLSCFRKLLLNWTAMFKQEKKIVSVNKSFECAFRLV